MRRWMVVPLLAVWLVATPTARASSVAALTASDVRAVEGDVGTAGVSVLVSLRSSASVPTPVSYATVPGTALPGRDFEPAVGVVVIPPGSTSTTVSVAVRGDATPEPDRTLQLRVAANGQTDTADIVILDDDRPTRVNVGPGGVQADGATGMPTSLQADGRFVVFSSEASTLTPDAQGPGGENGTSDIFVADTVLGCIVKASVAMDGGDPNDGSSGGSISADGTVVAFSSRASNIVAGDTFGDYDVFARNVVTGVTERLSVGLDGAAPNGSSFGTSMSADGRYVAFTSFASNLVSGDVNGDSDVFVRDRLLGRTIRASVLAGGAGAGFTPAISADGRYVVYDRSSGQRNVVYRYDLLTGATAEVSTDRYGSPLPGRSFEASTDAFGQHVAFVNDATGTYQVLVKDMATGALEQVSVTPSGAAGDDDSSRPNISNDGNIVTFESDATNLVDGDTNGLTDSYARSLVTRQTFRISETEVGGQPNGASSTAVAADGRVAAFWSMGDNIVAGDTNGEPDVFVRRTTLVPAVSVGDAQRSPTGDAAVTVTLSQPVNADVRVVYSTVDGQHGVVVIAAGARSAIARVRMGSAGTITVHADGLATDRGTGTIA